jgi:hypothetical protein
MGTPRALAPVDQMRNVQRTESCGEAIAHDRVREKESRSNETQSGAIAFSVPTQVAFNSTAEPFFASGWERGAIFFEVAQQVLFAQQPG